MQMVLAVLAFIVTTGALAAGGTSQDARLNATSTATGRAPVVTIDAVGDVMFGWGVGALVQTRGADAPFNGVRADFARADAIVGNLECPLSDRGAPTKSKSKKALKERKEFVLRGPPAAAIGLNRAGFAAMTLANNHILDYGPAALDDTLQVLHDNDVATAGAGDDAAAAWQPAIFERRGVRFALLGVSEVIPRGYGATGHTPGVAPGRDPTTGEVTTAYLRTLAHAIKLARAQADVVIVYEHWGKELASTPSPDHIRLAHAAIDAGASLVLGAHPHVLGPIEQYNGGLIAYSLGNFVFDTQPGIQTQGAILQITLRGPNVASWQAIPVVLKAGVPEAATGQDADFIRKLLAGTAASVPPPDEAQLARNALAPKKPAAGPQSPPNRVQGPPQ